MPEYAVTISHIYTFTARNEEQAQERGEMLEGALEVDPKVFKGKWNYDMDSSECNVEEI